MEKLSRMRAWRGSLGKPSASTECRAAGELPQHKFRPVLSHLPVQWRPRDAGRCVGKLRRDYPGSPAGCQRFRPTIFAAPRPSVLKAWLGLPHIALVNLGGDSVQAYGVARCCRQGFKVGPLFARDIETGTALLAALGEACGNEVHIEVPEKNQAFSVFLETAACRGDSRRCACIAGQRHPLQGTACLA